MIGAKRVRSKKSLPPNEIHAQESEVAHKSFSTGITTSKSISSTRLGWTAESLFNATDTSSKSAFTFPTMAKREAMPLRTCKDSMPILALEGGRIFESWRKIVAVAVVLTWGTMPFKILTTFILSSSCIDRPGSRNDSKSVHSRSKSPASLCRRLDSLSSIISLTRQSMLSSRRQVGLRCAWTLACDEVPEFTPTDSSEVTP
mmetsp:Transcript_99887/g.149647  ORF Transcript_99887/g.149647 Transcript_99887/m.149647 type:complete len:202 (+) Transcript_99887:56-661(+)